MLFSHPHSWTEFCQLTKSDGITRGCSFIFNEILKTLKRLISWWVWNNSQKHLQNWRPWQFTPLSYHIITLYAITCNISVISIHVWIYGWMCLSLSVAGCTRSFIWGGSGFRCRLSTCARVALSFAISAARSATGGRLITIIQDSRGAVLSKTSKVKITHMPRENRARVRGVRIWAVCDFYYLFFWRRGKREMKTGIGGL